MDLHMYQSFLVLSSILLLLLFFVCVAMLVLCRLLLYGGLEGVCLASCHPGPQSLERTALILVRERVTVL